MPGGPFAWRVWNQRKKDGRAVKRFHVEVLGQLCLDAVFVEEVSWGRDRGDPIVLD